MKTFIVILNLIILSSCSIQPDKPLVEESNEKTEKTDFVWDFKSDNKFVYNYSISESAQINWEGKIDVSTNEIKGRIEVVSTGNDKADILIYDDIQENILALPHDKYSKKEIKPIVIQELESKGNLEALIGYGDLIKANFFVLPRRDITKGEKDDINIKFPIKIMGSVLLAKGVISIKSISKNEKVLKSTISIKELKVPEELDFKATVTITGEGTYYFNDAEHRFESSAFNIQQNITLYRVGSKVNSNDIVHQSKRSIDVKLKYDETK